MKNATIGHKLRIAITLASAFLLSAAAAANGGGGHGGGGGGHGGGFGGHGGGHVGFAGHGGNGGWRGGNGGWRGGNGGWRGGNGGWRDGYGGWHGGGWRRGYGGWGWGWGALGLGLYFSALPWYYSTLWWDGIPYYYADGNYYLWDDSASAYETVNPPPAVAGQAAAGQGTPSDLIAYPKNGQTADQQAKDRNECRTWAAGQVGSAAGAPAATANNRDYLRAQAACLQGRGYSVQ